MIRFRVQGLGSRVKDFKESGLGSCLLRTRGWVSRLSDDGCCRLRVTRTLPSRNCKNITPTHAEL